MNKPRRKTLLAILDQLATAHMALDELRDAEQDAHDNLPDSLQAGTQGEALSANVDALDDACNQIESAADELRSHFALD